MRRTKTQIELAISDLDAISKTNPATYDGLSILVYVHGWKHNADAAMMMERFSQASENDRASSKGARGDRRAKRQFGRATASRRGKSRWMARFVLVWQ